MSVYYSDVRFLYVSLCRTNHRHWFGIDDLTLKPGESYTFDVTYEPAVPQFYTLRWFVTDDSVIEVDVVDSTVKALNPGEADILAESFDGVSFDVCHVTVTGSPQDEASKNDSKAGSGSDSSASFVDLSQKDRERSVPRASIVFLIFWKIQMSAGCFSQKHRRGPLSLRQA